jgi:hypothetical protein
MRWFGAALIDTHPVPAMRQRHEQRACAGRYFCGGGDEKISRLRPGSGFGFGLGAFLTSFLPLSLFPMYASITQKVNG